MPDVIITPFSGIVDFYPVASGTRVGRIDGSGTVLNIINPSGYISASGSGLSINTVSPNAVLHAYSPVSGSTVFSAEGTNGVLFSVIDSMSGSLFSVNTIAGLPAFEVFSDYSLKAGRYNQNDLIITSGGNVGIGTGNPTAKLHISNDIKTSEIDFAKIGDNTALATITLNNTNDLSITSVSGDVILGDPTQNIYIGNGINSIDLIFEQDGAIRPLSGKTVTVGASGAFTNILANKIGINQNSVSSIPLDIYSSTSGATIMNVAGTNGSLFSITDNLSGSLMSVNNIAGLPVFEVFSDDRVIAGRFGQNDFIITSGGNIGIGTGVPSSKFHVVGTSTFTGDVSSTGSFIAGSGSASNPSFEFNGDTDTGMFSPSGNMLSFATSGVERLRINDVGNIGIGTSTPSGQLHVIGSGIFSSGIRVGDSSTNGYVIGPSGNTYIQINNGSTNRIDIGSNTYTNSNLYLGTQYTYLNSANTYANGTFSFPATNTDPVGTSTQRDSNALNIYNKLWSGSAYVQGKHTIEVKASTVTNLLSRIAFSTHIGDGTTTTAERMCITSTNGYIGIGTSTPSGQLHVIGSGLFSSGIYDNNSRVVTQSSICNDVSSCTIDGGTYT